MDTSNTVNNLSTCESFLFKKLIFALNYDADRQKPAPPPRHSVSSVSSVSSGKPTRPPPPNPKASTDSAAALDLAQTNSDQYANPDELTTLQVAVRKNRRSSSLRTADRHSVAVFQSEPKNQVSPWLVYKLTMN